MDSRTRDERTEAGVTVRLATTDDLDSVLDQWLALVDDQHRHGTRLDGRRLPAREQLATAIVRNGVLVAATPNEDGEIVGFVTFGTERHAFEPRRTRGRIRMLYVEPDHRDRGIGGRLLETAHTLLLDRNCETVFVDVLVDNERARQFYRDHDFSPHRLTMERRPEVETNTNPSTEE